MNFLTVGELKQKLAQYPDNYILTIEHIEYDLIGEPEIATDIGIVGIKKIDGTAILAFETNNNLVMEETAQEKFKYGK